MRHLFLLFIVLVLILSGCSGADKEVTAPPECKNYSDSITRFISRDPDICNSIKIECESSRRPFSNECGCGCIDRKGSRAETTECAPEDRKAGICPLRTEFACGWFDPKKIQCIKAPCAETFKNRCYACLDKRVVAWTPGKCPE